MRDFLTILKIELVLWFRARENLFWSIGWPIMWFLFGYYIFPAYPGKTKMQMLEFYFPAGMALVLLSSSMTFLAIRLSINKENKTLRRLKIIPGSFVKYFLSVGMTTLLFSFFSLFILTGVGLVAGIRFSPTAPQGVAVVILGIAAYSAIAYLIAGISKRIVVASILSMIFMFLVIFLSSMFFDLSAAPKPIWYASRVLPGSPLCDTLRDVLFGGGSLLDHAVDLMVLAGWGIACSILSYFTFRIE